MIVDDIHQIRVDEYERAVEQFGWEHTELIRGVIYDVSPEHVRHALVCAAVARALHQAFHRETVLTGGSVVLGGETLVETDVFVVRDLASLDLDAPFPGATLVLAVEVRVSTHARDLGPKRWAYAEAGIPEYWVIDPSPGAGDLLRHTEPRGDRYQRIEQFAVGENAVDLDVATILGR